MTYRYSSPRNNWQELLLKHCTLFHNLSSDSIERAIANPVLRSYSSNHVIVLENDDSASIHFILEGWVKVRTHNIDGKEITLNLLSQGDLFGEMAALDAIPRSTDVITLGDTHICSIPSQDFLDLLKAEPMAGVHLSQLLALRLRQVNRRLRLREADSTARLVDVLLFLVDGQGREEAGCWVIPSFPHRELSSLSGLARETVTRVLRKLENKGLVSRDREVMRIPNLAHLESLVG